MSNPYLPNLLQALSSDLDTLAEAMFRAAQDLRDVRHAGGPDELADHADELAGVAEIVTGWGQGLRDDQ